MLCICFQALLQSDKNALEDEKKRLQAQIDFQKRQGHLLHDGTPPQRHMASPAFTHNSSQSTPHTDDKARNRSRESVQESTIHQRSLSDELYKGNYEEYDNVKSPSGGEVKRHASESRVQDPRHRKSIGSLQQPAHLISATIQERVIGPPQQIQKLPKQLQSPSPASGPVNGQRQLPQQPKVVQGPRGSTTSLLNLMKLAEPVSGGSRLRAASSHSFLDRSKVADATPPAKGCNPKGDQEIYL